MEFQGIRYLLQFFKILKRNYFFKKGMATQKYYYKQKVQKHEPIRMPRIYHRTYVLFEFLPSKVKKNPPKPSKKRTNTKSKIAK